MKINSVLIIFFLIETIITINLVKQKPVEIEKEITFAKTDDSIIEEEIEPIEIAHSIIEYPKFVPSKPDLDIIESLEQKKISVKILACSHNDVIVMVSGLERKRIIFPAGTILKADSPKFQNLILIKEYILEEDSNAAKLITCCANPGRHFGPAEKYDFYRLPENHELRKLAIELSQSNIPIRDGQQKIWTKSRTHPLGF